MATSCFILSPTVASKSAHRYLAGHENVPSLLASSAPMNVVSPSSPPFAVPLRTNRGLSKTFPVVCSAASSAGGQTADADENPYQVLGVSPFERFDMIKAAYAKRHKDAEKKGDESTLYRIEKAYDKIMMAQLANRKKGLTFGSFEVSKDIKYADKQPLFPWGPRYAPSSRRDILINLAISALFGAWIISVRSADWKPLQFLIFGFMWRIFMKLQMSEPAEPSFSNDEEGQGRRNRSGKRLLRTLGLVFSCIAAASLAYTGALNAIELVAFYIPRTLLNSQELIVTVLSSVLLFFMGSYYR